MVTYYIINIQSRILRNGSRILMPDFDPGLQYPEFGYLFLQIYSSFLELCVFCNYDDALPLKLILVGIPVEIEI